MNFSPRPFYFCATKGNTSTVFRGHPAHFTWMIRSLERLEFLTVVLGGSILSFSAGFINAVSLLTIVSAPVSHVSGTATQILFPLTVNDSSTSFELFLVLSFMFGAFIGAFITGEETFKMGRRYGVTLCIESCLLVIVSLLEETQFAMCILALACGIQNAMTSAYSGAIVRTTHMTGTCTDIGSVLAHSARMRLFNGKKTKDEWKLLVLVPLLLFYICGAGVGSRAYALWGMHALGIPAGILAGLGGAYYSFQIYLKTRDDTEDLCVEM